MIRTFIWLRRKTCFSHAPENKISNNALVELAALKGLEEALKKLEGN